MDVRGTTWIVSHVGETYLRQHVLTCMLLMFRSVRGLLHDFCVRKQTQKEEKEVEVEEEEIEC